MKMPKTQRAAQAVVAAQATGFVHPDDAPASDIADGLLTELTARRSVNFRALADDIVAYMESQVPGIVRHREVKVVIEAIASALEAGYAYGAAVHCPTLRS